MEPGSRVVEFVDQHRLSDRDGKTAFLVHFADQVVGKRGARLRPAPRQVQPGHTQVIDLTQDEDAILKDMKSTNRNLHRNIAKKGVTFTTSADPEDVDVLLGFLEAMKATPVSNKTMPAHSSAPSSARRPSATG